MSLVNLDMELRNERGEGKAGGGSNAGTPRRNLAPPFAHARLAASVSAPRSAARARRAAGRAAGNRPRHGQAFWRFGDRRLHRRIRTEALYLLESGKIPAGKLGARWVASKARLRKFFAELAG